MATSALHEVVESSCLRIVTTLGGKGTRTEHHVSKVLPLLLAVKTGHEAYILFNLHATRVPLPECVFTRSDPAVVGMDCS